MIYPWPYHMLLFFPKTGTVGCWHYVYMSSGISGFVTLTFHLQEASSLDHGLLQCQVWRSVGRFNCIVQDKKFLNSGSVQMVVLQYTHPKLLGVDNEVTRQKYVPACCFFFLFTAALMTWQSSVSSVEALITSRNETSVLPNRHTWNYTTQLYQHTSVGIKMAYWESLT